MIDSVSREVRLSTMICQVHVARTGRGPGFRQGIALRALVHLLVDQRVMVDFPDQQTGCGFGRTYASKFPQISANILAKKLEDTQKTDADLLSTECPGCIMQQRGGSVRGNMPFYVLHLSELLARAKAKHRCDGLP